MISRDGLRLRCKGVLTRYIKNSLLQAPRKKRSLEPGIDFLRYGHPYEQATVGVGPVHVGRNGFEMALKCRHEYISFDSIQCA